MINCIWKTIINLIRDIDFYIDVVILAIAYFIQRYIMTILINSVTYTKLDLINLSSLNGIIVGAFGLILLMRILNTFKGVQQNG